MPPYRPDILILIGRALAAMPDASADDELRWQFGLAIHAASRGSEHGFMLWDMWCQNRRDYDPDASGRMWVRFGGGLGVLFRLADVTNPDWRHPDIVEGVDRPPANWSEWRARRLAELDRAEAERPPSWVERLAEEKLSAARAAAAARGKDGDAS